MIRYRRYTKFKGHFIANQTALEKLEIQNALYLKYNQEKQNTFERAQEITHFRLVRELMADALEITINQSLVFPFTKQRKVL